MLKNKFLQDLILAFFIGFILRKFAIDWILLSSIVLLIITLVQLVRSKLVSHLIISYLRKKRIVLLSIASVAMSVALMLVVYSIFNGYIEALKATTVADIGEVLFWPRGAEIKDYSRFLDQLEEDPAIESASPFHYGGGLLYIEGADVREVVIYGIDPLREKRFSKWDEKLIRQSGAADPDFSVPRHHDTTGAWLGINIIAEPDDETDEYDFEYAKSFIGKQVVLTMVGSGSKRRVERFRVSDVVFSKNFFGDKTLYLPFDKFHEIDMGKSDVEAANYIKVKLAQGANSEQVAATLRLKWHEYATKYMGLAPEVVPPLAIRLRDELHGDIFEDLRNQMGVVLLIFGVICSVAVLLIFCIFYMIVTTRLKDIAIIKSCGSSSFSAASIFGGFGICIGVVGSALGVVLGILITMNANILEEWVRIIFGIKLWRTSSYGLAEIPHRVYWPVLPWIIIAAIIGCLIGALIPSIIAARTKPVKILRYE